MSKPVNRGIVDANGTKLYYELRGAGPSLLFIPGAEGDAEEYLKVVEQLDHEFATVSYDRRAFSRSPRPTDFDGTTVEQQADDAAALLQALGMAPAALWGNSSGAIIGLSLVLRHPEVVSTAMLHEPPLFAGMSDPQQVRRSSQQITVNGKLPFLRTLEGDVVYESFSEGYRDRLSADNTWINYEFDNFEYYKPADDDLAAVERPVAVLYGADSPAFFAEAATWLADRLGAVASTIPGGHGVHYELPGEVVKAIRSFMARD